MSGSDRGNEGEEAFVRQLKTMLDDGNARLDARVRSRLTQARHAALAQADARPVLVSTARREPPPDESASDLEIVLAGENLDLLEDLDFYEWVDADTQQNSI